MTTSTRPTRNHKPFWIPHGVMRRTAAVAAATLCWWGAAAQAAPPAASAANNPVPTVVVRLAHGQASQWLDGSVQAVHQANVSAQVAGNVTALLVKAGDTVKAGQVLARVDERDLQAGLQRSDAAVAQAEAEWRNARTQATRQRDLRAQGFVSQAALDVADTQLKAAEAALAQARAGRGQAALARGFANVTAPFDGVVLATLAEAGDLAQPGRPIATVYAPGQLRAVVQVPSSRLALARAAQEVQVLTADGRRFTPTQSRLMPGTDAVSQTVEWRLDLPDAAGRGPAALAPGQSVQLRFSAAANPAAATASTPAATPATAQVLRIPAAALLRRGELTAVYVVQDQRFVLRAVRAGVERAGAEVDVLAGLRAGERIALDAVRAGLDGATPAAAAP